MSLVAHAIKKQKRVVFNVSHSPQYKTFIINRIVTEPNHPLYVLKKRAAEQRKKEGLWWHVVVYNTLSKSSVVRSWARRRVRNAFIEELKERGFNDKGILVNPGSVKWANLDSALNQGKEISLKGSLKFQLNAPSVSAKYADVRKEMSSIVDALVLEIKNELSNIFKTQDNLQRRNISPNRNATTLAPKHTKNAQNSSKPAPNRTKNSSRTDTSHNYGNNRFSLGQPNRERSMKSTQNHTPAKKQGHAMHS
ncbi:hypothetical protein BS50DRAFT_572102 [Corynespora cassiicola Philippines]|uniref:Uncharacterized protein n=1 Tax=Corynespora cassiicola Philippines TaxID=1448308 RepID=A0A2T2NU06_CORCC|nr:hypothetical protein BS50DRAFT_572102 [Corynespora cassiicola Philippines]